MNTYTRTPAQQAAVLKFKTQLDALRRALFSGPRFDYLMAIHQNNYIYFPDDSSSGWFGHAPIRIYREATEDQKTKMWSFNQPQTIKEARWLQRFLQEKYPQRVFSGEEKALVFEEFRRDFQARVISSLWLKGFEEYHPIDIFTEFCLESVSLFVRAESMFKKELLEQITLFFEVGGITGNQFVSMTREEQVVYTEAHYHKIWGWLWKRAASFGR